MIAEPERFTIETAKALEDSGNELLLSAVSSWEIAIKHSLGKLALPAPPATYVPQQIAKTGVTPLPVEHSHALRVAALPAHHRDPFTVCSSHKLSSKEPRCSRATEFAPYSIPIQWA